MKTNEKAVSNLLLVGLNHILAEWDGSKAENLGLLASGWESDIYALEKTKNGHSDNVVMRYFATGRSVEDATKEWDVLFALHQVGYPVPKLFGCPPSKQLEGRYFFLMERIDGYPLWSKLKTSQDYVIGLEQVAALMVELHQIDPHVLTLPIPENGKAAMGLMLKEWRQILDAAEPMSVAFNPVLEWFESRLESLHDWPLAIVHFDLHPENVMVETSSGRMLVIDWTGVCISDPRLDVYWAALLVGHQAAEPYFEVLTHAYEKVCGSPLEDCAFFEALVSIRRIASLMLTILQGAESRAIQGDVAANISHQIPHLRTIYRRFINATEGMRIPAVEVFFAQFPD